MQHATIAITVLLLINVIIWPSARAQNTPEPEPDLADILTPTVDGNEASSVFFPSTIFRVETPIAIRFVLAFTIANYDSNAACNDKALSFFGTKDFIPPNFCSSRTSRAVINAYLTHRIHAAEFPIEAPNTARFLQKNGLSPFNQSRDMNTEVGWANVIADRFLQFLAKDGWNSLGDETKEDYRAQFEDSTGYKPQNPSHLSPSELKKPLRWQPLTGPSDMHGRFATQVHVVPQIGIRGSPIALSKEDFESRKAPPLWKTANRRRSIGKEDMKTALSLIRGVFRRSKRLNKEKLALVHWWESKFFSLGAFVGFYQQIYKYDDVTLARLLLGEAIAQHDAVLLAWKEKLRYDSVRPTTLIRRLLKGRRVMAWRGLSKGVCEVSAEEWEPAVPIQPHSEYPSASAVICTASLEHMRAGLEDVVKVNGTIAAFETTIVPGVLPGNPVQESVKVRFRTLEEAARDCGESRLNGGVHFAPSVPVGEMLGKGIGKIAADHVTDLFEGRIPTNCERCIR